MSGVPVFFFFFFPSKGIGFIKERVSTKLSEQTLRGVKSLPQGRDYSSFISLPVLICAFLVGSCPQIKVFLTNQFKGQDA